MRTFSTVVLVAVASILGGCSSNAEPTPSQSTGEALTPVCQPGDCPDEGYSCHIVHGAPVCTPPPPEPTFACGWLQCHLKTEYCEISHVPVSTPVPYNDGGDTVTNYACAPVPAQCLPAPSCGCLAPGARPGVCQESGGGFIVDCLCP